MCERCHDELGFIVHHKTYVSEININDAEITLNHSNLEYVCHVCHNREHMGEYEEVRYMFDDTGMIMPIAPLNAVVARV